MATVDKNFRVKNGLVVEGTTGTINGNNIVTDADTTDILSEGTSNLYFTDQRAKDAITSGVTTDGIDEGTTNLYFTDERVQEVLVNSVQENIVITSTDGVLFITAENGVEDSTTDDLDEGTVNLYFTAERVLDVVSGGGEGFTTDSVTEGTTNLYYTDARVESVIANSDTDDISEGTTNLYYTDSRSRSAISGGTGINYDSESGEVAVDTDEIATVAYVNATAEGLHVHTAVAVATTANIADLSSPPAEIDGVSLTEGMRVLVKDQETKSENGIYVVDSGALVRAEDHDTAEKVRSGDFVFVTGGSTQSATGFVQVNDVTTLGTDPIEWTQFIGAGVFTAGTGLDLTGNVFSLDATTDLVAEGTANLYYTNERVESVIAGSDTDDLSEGTTNLYYTDARVEAVIAGSDTDDISEGTLNLYYTTQRVYDALVASTQENIQITTTDGLLFITAENGVEDSTTDDLDEGTLNLYFTDQRAVDALEAVVPNFTEVDLNSVATQVAATSNLSTTASTAVYSFAKEDYRTAKFLVKASHGVHTEASEVLLTLDTSDNIAITEYAIVSTNGSLITVTAEINGANVDLVAVAETANTDVTVAGTLVA